MCQLFFYYNSILLILFQWVVQAGLVNFQAENSNQPRQLMKEAFNILENRYSICLRCVQSVLILVILLTGLLGAKPEGCSSRPAHILEMSVLSAFLVSIIISHQRLIKSLKLRYHAMY